MSTQGERLKTVRLALKVSQEEFGRILNVSKQYISNLEANRNILNNEKLVSLLLNYNVNLNYLLGGIGEPFLETPQQDEQLKKLVAQIVEKEMKKYGVIDKCI